MDGDEELNISRWQSKEGAHGASDDIILKGQSICSLSHRTDCKSSGLAAAVGSMRMLSLQPLGDTVRQLSLERAVREQCRPQTARFQGSQAGDGAPQEAKGRSWAWCGLRTRTHLDGMVGGRLHTHSCVRCGLRAGRGYCTAWVGRTQSIRRHNRSQLS